jgi:23S rRNA (cytidine1920-2'-O)/16S rRNA (cytidine1409-2'-O)-methyltransferase
MVKDRADKILAELGLVASRSQAKSLIEKGDVLVDGVALKRASELISNQAKIEIKSPLYVGRGAFKFSLSPKNQVWLDVGASTGGFTEVLLLQGAKKVFAIDVGHDQLAPKLKTDPRVINMEGVNIRDLTVLPELADGAVMDLSFISITKVLDSLKKLLKPSSPLIALIKPQFEAGIERIPKDGVIKDEKVREQILAEVIDFAVKSGWRHLGTVLSPIEGKSGNLEYLAWFQLKD